MSYEQQNTITSLTASFDSWLADLAKKNQQYITASEASDKLGVEIGLARDILRAAEEQGILESCFWVKCPDCGHSLDVVTKDKIADVLVRPVFCRYCGGEKRITTDQVYIAYKVVRR